MSGFNKELVIQDFDRAASHYDEYAKLQHEVAGDVARLVKQHADPEWWLDLGCGTGYLAKAVKKPMIQLDIAPRMCTQASQAGLVMQADMEMLPLADRSVPAITSSLALQWSAQPRQVLHEAYRVLQQDGVFIASTLGPETLSELRTLFARVSGQVDRMQNYMRSNVWYHAMVQAGFAQVDVTSYTVRKTYKSMDILLKHIRNIGASNKYGSRFVPLSKTQFFHVRDLYHKIYQTQGGVYASWELLIIKGKKTR